MSVLILLAVIVLATALCAPLWRRRLAAEARRACLLRSIALLAAATRLPALTLALGRMAAAGIQAAAAMRAMQQTMEALGAAGSDHLRGLRRPEDEVR